MSIIFSLNTSTVKLSRNPQPNTWNYFELNSGRLELSDGSQSVYIDGPLQIKGTLDIRYLKDDEAEDMRQFLRTVTEYGKNQFTITPDSNTDLGLGKGVAMIGVWFDSEATDQEIIISEERGPSRWRLIFPYKYTLSTAEEAGIPISAEVSG